MINKFFKTLLSLIFILTLLFPTEASSNKLEEANKYLKEGLSFLKKADYNKAIHLLLEASKLSPNNYSIYVGLGIAYYNIKDYNKSIFYYKKAIDILKPNYAFNKLKEAKELENKKKYIEAIKVYNFIFNINPTAGNLLLKANTLITQNKINEAIKLLNQAISIDKNYADAYYLLGNIYVKLNNLDSAIFNLENAVNYDKENLNYLLTLADTYYKVIKNTKDDTIINNAISIYTKLINNGLKKESIFYNLSNIYLLKEEYQKAIETINSAFKLNIYSVKLQELLGFTYFKLGYSINDSIKKLELYNKAIEQYNLCTIKNPNYSNAYYNLGTVYYYKSSLKPTSEYIINEINTQNSLFYYKEGIKFFKKDMLIKSKINYEKYLQLEPKSINKEEIQRIIADINQMINI